MSTAFRKFLIGIAVVALGSVAIFVTSAVSSTYRTAFATSILKTVDGATWARPGWEHAATQRAVARVVFQCASIIVVFTSSIATNEHVALTTLPIQAGIRVTPELLPPAWTLGS